MKFKTFAALGSLTAVISLAGVTCVSDGGGPASVDSLDAQSNAGAPSNGSPPRPPDVRTETYGESVLGERLEAVSVGSGPRVVVVVGGLHTGLEAETSDLVAALRDEFTAGRRGLPGGVQVVFVAEANPDGQHLETRVNAHDVDLNRNWPTGDWAEWATHGDAEVYGGDSPLSEPETLALYEYLRRIEPDLVVSMHGFAGVVHHNGLRAAESLGELFAAAAGFELTANWEHYDVTGDMIESMAELGVPAADVELFEGDPNSLMRVRRGLDAVLRTLADGGGSS